MGNLAEQTVALDRAGITVFREITFLAAGPASERSRSAALSRYGRSRQSRPDAAWRSGQMQVEEHIQSLDGAFAEFVPPPRLPFCLQPGHKDAVARNARPDFARRLQRGEEAHVVTYFAMTAIVWFPSLVIFGTLGGIIGRVAGAIICRVVVGRVIDTEAFFIAGMIVGALVGPAGSIYSGIAGLREIRRRAKLYSQGQLLLGTVTGCVARDDYYCNPSNPDAMPERTGASVVTLWYCFQTPAGRRIEDSAQAGYQERPQPWPENETPVVVLYLDDDYYEVL
jgi:hypothetical protein